MLFKKKPKPAKKDSGGNLNHHFLFIEAPVEIVGPQAVLWGEAVWWPKACPMRFKRITEGGITVGTRYRMKIRHSPLPAWKVEVTEFVPNRFVRRTFLSGMFKGYEEIEIGERSNGARIDYRLYYRIRGLHNLLLWPFVYQKKHDENIQMILAALQEYCVNQHQGRGEEEQ